LFFVFKGYFLFLAKTAEFIKTVLKPYQITKYPFSILMIRLSRHSPRSQAEVPAWCFSKKSYTGEYLDL
jgi:hypothetical protein